ncbi:MAG: UbiD family decarboxylase [Chloroflexi bacterium]|nr:UbiD family decarboxylase [Chloroflexota bacterium]
MRDLQDYLQFLRERHPEELVWIEEPIDPKECEHAAYETYFESLGRYPWIVFEHARCANGERWPGLFATGHLNNFRKMGLALGLDLAQTRPFDVVKLLSQALRHPEDPEVIPSAEAPVKARTLAGADANFDLFPIFRNCEQDSRPGWLTPIIIARDLDTGRYNFSWHRFSYNSPTNATIRYYPGRQLYDYWQKYRARHEPMPVALVLGHHAAFSVASATRYPMGTDELACVGGVYRAGTGERLRVTPSETWGRDLLVPADAEVVIEGYIHDRYDYEGPFTDWLWTYAPQYYHPTLEPTAITMKQRPIIEGQWPKTHIIHYPPYLANIYESLLQNFPTVKSVNYLPCLIAIVSFRPTKAGQAKNLGLSLFQLGEQMKQVIVVDEDIDPFNLTEVFYAVGTRVDTRRDVHLVTVEATNMDPSATDDIVGGMVIDATKPVGVPFPEIGYPPREMVQRLAAALSPEVVQRVALSSKWGW